MNPSLAQDCRAGQADSHDAFVPRLPDQYSDEMNETTTTIAENAATADAPAVEFVEEELLVEEISIDGMCGVY